LISAGGKRAIGLGDGEPVPSKRCGDIRCCAAGSELLTTGKDSPGLFVLIQGTIAVTSRDGLGHLVPIAELGPGDFVAEVGQLSGQPSLVDAHAKTDVEALLVTTENIRALLIAEADSASRSCAP
jgi:thioredoxin reductase (NADPH)